MITSDLSIDSYLASKRAATKPHRGLRFSRVVPPGAE